MLVRRDFLPGVASVGLATLTPAPARSSTGSPFGGEPFARAIRAAEAQGGGRLGVAVLDTETGKRFAWRGSERFPLTSTFKLVLAGAVLAEVDRGRERLDRRIPIAASDLVEYAPVTGKHVGAGLPEDWRCGDKTGEGGYDTTNDIAILWPPGRRPILVASYLTETTASLDASNAALAAVGRAIAAVLV